MTALGPLHKPPDFSLVLGGPGLSNAETSALDGPALEMLRRRVVISVLLCWVPLAVLSLAQSHFLDGAKLSFFRDIETHVRFLVSLPVLILAEMVVHQRIRPVVKGFIERRVVTEEELPKFYCCDRLRNAYTQLSHCRSCASYLRVHRWHMGLAASGSVGCRKLVRLTPGW